MVVEGESKIVEAESVVYIPPNKEHYLENNTDEPLEMMFVYSPATIVDHWEKERRGELS
jgi:oxalate decarboxylase/phosphoglucose isomerase-like protein (cupin superfamily)